MSKTVFAFGRMNPPTIGHEKLADKVASEAKRRGAMSHIYLSHTQNAKKDPLPYNVKIAIAKKAFGKAVTKSSAKNIIQIMQELEKMGHTEVTLIAGSDRVPEFKTLLNKYNGKDYNFKKIDVVSAGERDPDAEGVAGMSASKLRGIAQAGDYDTFVKGMPSKLRDSDKKKVYDTIRSVMESYSNIDESALSALRVATAAHKGQKRKSGGDYISHPKEVARIVKQYKKSHNLDALIQAAYLHDTIEDTDTTYKDLVKQFGGLVAGMVKDLTSDKEAIEAMGKGEYMANKMAKMTSWSLVIKLADRLANVGDIDDRPAEFQKKYANQTKLALDKLKKDRYLSKTHKKIMAAIDDKIKEYVTESVMEDYDPTDEELDEILLDLDNDDDLSWEWDEDQLELDLDEARNPLTLAQRMKKRILMRRLAPRIARKRKIAMRRRAGREQLTKRARRAAVLLLKKKVAGNKGKNYKSLSPSEKIGIDRLVQKRLGMVDKIAKRLLPKMQKKETERMRNRSKTNENFELFIEQKVAQDPDVDERPGTQPKKYYSGVRKKSKEARAKHFERGAKMDDDNPAAYSKAPGDAEGKTKPSKHTKRFKQMFGEEVTAKQISDLEKFGDRLLAKFDVDIEFSRHFADRMNDSRNNPEIKVAEIQALFKKIARKKAANIKKHANSEVVLKDIQKDLNLPVAIKMDKNGEIEVVHKTIMRKKNFKTPNAVVQYEDVNEAFEAEYLEEKQIDALKKKSEKTGISYSILKQVYNRGMAAWRTGHRPGTTPQQWAFARVNSFATKSKGTWGGADKDLAAKARGSTKKEEVSEADPCWDGYKQVGMKKNASGKDVPNCVPESVELGESKYDLYHRDFSSAMQHAYKMAKKLHGITIDSKEIDDKVATGPRKPSEGKTNKYRLKGDKGAIQVQVYNKGGSKPFELNMYKEEVELGEDKEISDMIKHYEDMLKSLERKKKKTPGIGFAKIKIKEIIAKLKKDLGEEVELDEKVEFETDKDLPNLRKPKKTTDYEFRKYLSKLKGGKSRERDYFKSNPRFEGNGAASPAQQAAIAIAKKKSGKYDDNGKKIDEQDAAADAKDRHNREKERLKDKHDRELDAARLRDTRTKNTNEAFEALIEQSCCDDCLDEDYGWEEETDFVAIDESAAEYQGRKVKLNNPTRSDNPKKKTMVYVKNEKGNVVKVYFGDPNLSIKRDDPERRKNFRARHNCDNPGPKWKARYWSCKFWSSKKVSDLMKG